MAPQLPDIQRQVGKSASCDGAEEDGEVGATKALGTPVPNGGHRGARRPPMHPQPHALASTGSSRPGAHPQTHSPPGMVPSRAVQSAGMPHRSPSPLSGAMHRTSSSAGSESAVSAVQRNNQPNAVRAGSGVDATVQGGGPEQALLLGSPHSSTSSCSVTFLRGDGHISPGPAAQPRSAPPTPSALRGPTHRPNTPAKKRLSLVPTPTPVSPPPSFSHSVRLPNGVPVARSVGGETDIGSHADDLQKAAADARLSDGDRTGSRHMSTPTKSATDRLGASSTDTQASSTEADDPCPHEVTSNDANVGGDSPSAKSPGDASSPSIQFSARPVLGQEASFLHGDKATSALNNDGATWSAPSLRDALEAAAATAPDRSTKLPMLGRNAEGIGVQITKPKLELGAQAHVEMTTQHLQLSSEARNLAEAYGAALASSQHVHLAAEVELLLHMLAVPADLDRIGKPLAVCDAATQFGTAESACAAPGVSEHAGADQSAKEKDGRDLGFKSLQLAVLLRTGHHAHEFACLVLQRAGMTSSLSFNT